MRKLVACTLVAITVLSACVSACTVGSVAQQPASRVTEQSVPTVVVAQPTDVAARPQPTPDPVMDAANPPTVVSIDALSDATYAGIYDQPVALIDGRYEGEPFVEGGASRPTLILMPELVGYGDLNDNGQLDASVLLLADSGGSGTFAYLAAVEPRAGKLVNLATTFLGDRLQVRSLAVDDGQLLVELLTQGPEDPACCPTLEAIRAFRLDGQRFVEDVAP